MNHPVAVAAEQGEVTDSCFVFTCLVERLNVVAFDIALPSVTIDLSEVETARLAGQRIATAQHATDLLASQSRVALALGMEAPQVAAFQDAAIVILLELRDIFRRVVERILEQVLRDAMHDIRGRSELIHNLLIPLAAVGPPLSPIGGG